MMTPRDAEYKQAEIFQKMSADQKVDVMVEMWKSVQEIKQKAVTQFDKLDNQKE